MPRPTAATLAAAAATTRRPLLRPAALTHATTHVTLATPWTLAIESVGVLGMVVIPTRGAAAAAGVPPETPPASTQVTQRPPSTLFRRHPRPRPPL